MPTVQAERPVCEPSSTDEHIAGRTESSLAAAPPASESAGESAGETQDPFVAEYWDWLKIPVSMWLIFHLAAMVLYPASVGNPPRELLSRVRDRIFERYMEALFMTGGHRFFAPEPGPSALVQYRLEQADGRVTEGIFPHRSISPRLLYHRYFMLSERPMDVFDRRLWHRMYARHLAYWFDAERVTIWRVLHRLPNPDDVIAGKSLDDPEFYDYEAMGTWTREELEAVPLLPPDDFADEGTEDLAPEGAAGDPTSAARSQEIDA